MMPKFMDKITRNEPTYGTWITMAYPEIVEALSYLPFDWFVFDMEHAPLTIRDIEFLMMAIKNNTIAPIVRVPWNDFVVIKQALDIGAQGLIVPYVNNKDEAVRVIKATRYPPEGIRGVGPRRCANYGFTNVKEYFKQANKEIIVIVQIETVEAVENVDEILPVDGINGVFIGPNDLSASLGIFREFDNPRYINALNKVLNAAKSMNKIAGIMAQSTDDALSKTKKGFNFISLSHDLSYLIKGYTDAFKTLGRLT
ncbi:MAG: aldolase/citrate lyase family protein [Thermoprotei archaeon]